jgi:hypothetical protein
MHSHPMLVLDPGGVPATHHNAAGTAAFRLLETVGFPLYTPVRDILRSTMIGISGLHHAACLLGLSSFVRPLLGMHVEFPTDLRVRL